MNAKPKFRAMTNIVSSEKERDRWNHAAQVSGESKSETGRKALNNWADKVLGKEGEK